MCPRGAMHEAKAQDSFCIKSRTGEDMGQFSASPTNKALGSFRNSLKSDLRHSEYFSLLKKVFTLTVFALS